MLYEDLGVPAAYLEPDSFSALAGAWDFPAGWHWKEPVLGLDAVASILAAVNGLLIPRRDGRLAARSLFQTGIPTARYSAAEIVSATPVALPDELRPPPYRWRVQHTRCHTVQTSDFAPLISAERLQFLASEYRAATWSDADVLAAYARPNDPAPIATALLSSTGAETVASALGQMWSRPRRLYDLRLPQVLAARHEIGETLLLDGGLPEFRGGATALVVGDRLRAADQLATLRVLV